MGIDDLKSTWTILCNQLWIHQTHRRQWWKILQEEYSRPIRSYHTLQHIAELVDFYNHYKYLIQNHSAVLLGIFFHDVIYDPRGLKDQNENESQNLFHLFVADCSTPLLIAIQEEVIQMIEITKNHTLNQDDSFDLKIFCDMDMAILGADRSRYRDYSRQIRAEYSHIPLKEFAFKRSEFLRHFLERTKRIFYTDIFYSRFESRARENLQWEIQYLESIGSSSISLTIDRNILMPFILPTLFHLIRNNIFLQSKK